MGTTNYISHRDMTKKEKQQTWIQQTEAMSIKMQCKQIILDVEEYQTEDLYESKSGHKICLRGLESCLRLQSQQKKRNRLEAQYVVLYEQEEQRYERGMMYDEEAIATAYRSRASDCQLQAELKANLDRDEIEDYLKE